MERKNTLKRMAAAAVMVLVTAAMTVTAFAGSGISLKKAENIALKDAGLKKAQVKRLESEKDGSKFEVEFVRKSNGAEYDYEITSKGKIREKSVDYVYKKNSSRSKIGKEAAQKKAASHSGVSLSKVKKGTCYYEYDSEDKEGKYEVKFKSGGYKYDYDILAPTGTVMEFSKKLIK